MQVDELIELAREAVETLAKSAKPGIHPRFQTRAGELGVLPLFEDRGVDRVQTVGPPVRPLKGNAVPSITHYCLGVEGFNVVAQVAQCEQPFLRRRSRH